MPARSGRRVAWLSHRPRQRFWRRRRGGTRLAARSPITPRRRQPPIAPDARSISAAQTARKEALAAEAEDPPPTPPSKSAGDRMRTILEEWRTITGLDRKTDDALWKQQWRPATPSTAAAERIAELDPERRAREAKERTLRPGRGVVGKTGPPPPTPSATC